MSDLIGDAGSRNAERIRELERRLAVVRENIPAIENYARIMEKKLAIAVEALENISQFEAYPGIAAKEALAKIQSK